MELLRFTDPLTHHDNAPEEKKAIPEDQRMNPECPCRTRGCEYHGFCKLCVAKHQRLIDAGVSNHGSICQRIKAGQVTLDPERRP